MQIDNKLPEISVFRNVTFFCHFIRVSGGERMFWCSCGSPSAPPSWLYEGEVNPDGYWITGFSVHMQAPPAAQLCDSGGLSVSWKVFTGSCWCGADIYSGGKTAQAKWNVWIVLSHQKGPRSHWTHCATFIPPPPSRGFYLTVFVQLILEAALGDLLYGYALGSRL